MRVSFFLTFFLSTFPSLSTSSFFLSIPFRPFRLLNTHAQIRWFEIGFGGEQHFLAYWRTKTEAGSRKPLGMMYLSMLYTVCCMLCLNGVWCMVYGV